MDTLLHQAGQPTPTLQLQGLRLGVLVSEYPARSHTFVRRELQALRARGAEVHVFAIRRLPENQLLDATDRAEFDSTSAILPAAPLGLLQAHAHALTSMPLTFLRTAQAALTHRLPGMRNLTWAGFYLAEATILARKLEQSGVQHLHTHFANAGAHITRLAARLAGITWSMTLHGACDFEYPFGPILAQKVREAEFTVCISQYGVSQAMRELDPEHWDKLVLSRCGIEPWQMPPARGPHTDRARLNITCVGRLSAEKGQLGLLEAFANARRQDARLHLTLVGDGPTRARVEARIAELGIAEHVTLTGALAERDALAQIAQSDALVLASFMEGIPVVLMEAMALHVPVIAPRLAGIPELVEHDVSGLLFHPADWRDLTGKLLQLSADAALRERLATTGRERVLRDFAMPHAIDNFAARLGKLRH